MKKQYIMIMILFGCCLSVYQVVQAQKSSDRLSIFKQLQNQVDKYLSPGKENNTEEEIETVSAKELAISEKDNSTAITNDVSELASQIQKSDSELSELNKAILEQVELTNQFSGDIELSPDKNKNNQYQPAELSKEDPESEGNLSQLSQGTKNGKPNGLVESEGNISHQDVLSDPNNPAKSEIISVAAKELEETPSKTTYKKPNSETPEAEIVSENEKVVDVKAVESSKDELSKDKTIEISKNEIKDTSEDKEITQGNIIETDKASPESPEELSGLQDSSLSANTTEGNNSVEMSTELAKVNNIQQASNNQLVQEIQPDNSFEIESQSLNDTDNQTQHASFGADKMLDGMVTSEYSPEVEYFIQQYQRELQAEQSSQTNKIRQFSENQPVEPEPEPVAVEVSEETPARTSIFTRSLASELGASTEVAPFISIDEGPLVAAIRQLARQAKINFIFDPRIISGLNEQGQAVDYPKVTIRFENVTAIQALEAVLDSYDLDIIQNKKTKIAKVTFKAAPQEEILQSHVIQIKYHSASEMVELLSTFIGPRSTIKPHSKSSKIVVSATTEELERIAELIYELDVPSRNVLIEANILETSRNPTSLRGIDWSGTFANNNITFGNGKTTGSQSAAGDNITTDFDPSGISQVYGGAFSPSVAFLNSDGLNAVLNFLNSDSETKVVATPRTVTQNEVEATLAVTRAFPIFQESPGSQAVPSTTSIIYTNLGTILKVLPRISADDSVTLEVEPEISSVDGKDQSQIGGRISEANIYAIRRMQTTVRVPSGHTLVMGGLTSDKTSETKNKVPLLGDIPILGNLFQNTGKNQEKRNMIVFITPTIVKEEDYQPASTDFLDTKLNSGEKDEEFITSWDQAEPYQW